MKSSAFIMPKVSQGMNVLWRQEPGRAPEAAVVTSVGTRSIEVSIFPRGQRALGTRGGVRHISDPELRDMVHQDNGCWEYTERDREINRLID